MANPSASAGAPASSPPAAAAASATATSTPVKVPSAAASYTPATLDPDLRSQINMVLIRDGHVGRIQDHLLHTLHADTSDWPAAVQAHALALLRTGGYSTFPALLERVMDDIRRDTQEQERAAAAAAAGGTAGSNNATNNNNNTTPAKQKKRTTAATANGTAAAAAAAAAPSLAFPAAVVEEALRATRESLEMVCEIEE